MKILWKDLVMDLAVALVKLTGGHCIFFHSKKIPVCFYLYFYIAPATGCKPDHTFCNGFRCI